MLEFTTGANLKIWVNAEHVVCVEEELPDSTEAHHCRITLTGGKEIRLLQRAETVRTQVNDAVRNIRGF